MYVVETFWFPARTEFMEFVINLICRFIEHKYTASLYVNVAYRAGSHNYLSFLVDLLVILAIRG